MHPTATVLAAAHDGLLVWRLMRAGGMSEHAARHAVRGLRQLHAGVWLTGHARVTPHQRWLAAALTTDDTVLSHASGGAFWAVRPRRMGFDVVTRPGDGGPKRVGNLLVCRSLTLAGHVVVHDGVRVTTPARTLIDLSPFLNERQAVKAAREALRLTPMTAVDLRACLALHHGRRGTAILKDAVDRLEPLPIAATRSDAEAYALQLLHAAGRLTPAVNVVRAGFEADLSWPSAKLIVEIDGGQFHRHPGEDARRDAAWRAAGWTVVRISSDDVFHRPQRLLDLAPPRPIGPLAR